VKLKLGRDLAAEAQALARLREDQDSLVRLRFDFNSTLKAGELDAFLERLPVAVRSRVEFIEDPFAFEARVWAEAQKRLQIILAADLEIGSPEEAAEAARSQAAGVLVVKPAKQDDCAFARAFLAASGYSVIVTSSMDHPLGQIAAAYRAAKLRAEFGEAVGICGLLSQTAFFPNEFSESLRIQGPQLVPPGGTGFGFDDLLHQQEWTRV
jgi:O-succinylbenzoate synthase